MVLNVHILREYEGSDWIQCAEYITQISDMTLYIIWSTRSTKSDQFL